MSDGNSQKKAPNKLPFFLFVAIAIIILVFSLIIFVLWIKFERSLSIWLLLIFLIIPAAITIGTVFFLFKRFNDISSKK